MNLNGQARYWTWLDNSISEICQIRLDFVTTGLGLPTDTTGKCDNDNLVITPGVGSLAGANPPSLCGTLTGQHGTMYNDYTIEK